MTLHISHATINQLIAQYGEKADACDVKALVRIYDPASSWQCYIYAIDPWDTQTFKCLVGPRGHLDDEIWTFDGLNLIFNMYGDGARVDAEYRPKLVSQLLKEARE